MRLRKSPALRAFSCLRQEQACRSGTGQQGRSVRTGKNADGRAVLLRLGDGLQRARVEQRFFSRQNADIAAALFLLLAIVLRCIQVGMKSPDYMNRLICIGIASMLLFQILINVGVCLGLFPVVGLALPFLSYGGSSILTSFLAMGIVSGIKMRPAPDMSAHYIRPY